MIISMWTKGHAKPVYRQNWRSMAYSWAVQTVVHSHCACVTVHVSARTANFDALCGRQHVLVALLCHWPYNGACRPPERPGEP